MPETMPAIPCGLCGRFTLMLDTKRCDRCYELETRIHRDPDLARKVLDENTELAKLLDRLEGAVFQYQHNKAEGFPDVSRQAYENARAAVFRFVLKPK